MWVSGGFVYTDRIFEEGKIVSDFYLVELSQGFNSEQRALFFAQAANHRKSKTVAFLLTFFLGGIGAHRYYLGSIGLGLLYTIFAWTFVPILIAFMELFLIGSYVDDYNRRQAEKIAEKISTLPVLPTTSKLKA